jgi:DnaJ-class molecular chaperone
MKLLKLIRLLRRACPRCFGTGQIEIQGGDQKDCPICKGKGMLE